VSEIANILSKTVEKNMGKDGCKSECESEPSIRKHNMGHKVIGVQGNDCEVFELWGRESVAGEVLLEMWSGTGIWA
jgi:hypothetical protein